MKTKVMALLLIVILLLTMAVGCSSGGQQPATAAKAKFPEKAIDMTILFGAGSAADIVARKLGDLVSKDLGQPVVANNRLGGGGAVGYQYVLGAKPDGYSIVWNSSSINVTHHQGNMPKDQGYDAFRGVANITQEATAIAVKPDAKWKTIDEFIAYAKEHPGEIKIANSGVGSFNHLIAAAFENAAGIKVKHIPMDAKQSQTALLGGQVDAMVNMAFDVIQQQKAGNMRTLAVVSDKRLTQLPDVPTLKEKGINLDMMMWRGIAVPKNTPDDVVKILEASFMKAGNSQEFKDFVTQYGVLVDVRNGAEFDKLMAQSDKDIADIMEKIGLKKQ